MTAPILGTLAGKKTRDHGDFVQKFIESITREEWQVIAQVPQMKRVEQLILFVIAMRKVPRYPLPQNHPLNPASRYEATA